MPELLIFVLPTTAGIIGSGYLGRFANFGFMLGLFQIDIAVMVFINTGRFNPELLIPFNGSVFGGVSTGGLVPPLAFVLVAIISNAFRKRDATL